MTAKFPSVRVEGGLLASDLLDSIASGEASGQKAKDFCLPEKSVLLDAVSSAYADARSYWDVFNRRAEKLGEGETGVTFTRQQWIVPLLGLLGYRPRYQEKAAEVGGLTFAISHRAEDRTDAPPIHIVGVGQSIDERADSGRPRLSPHALLQDYLNRTDHLWGLVTNGKTLRVLRDSQLLRRQAFIEFDLRAMFETDDFSGFALFFRLLHRTRLPEGEHDVKSCWLERYWNQTVEEGGRVRDKLREGVEQSIETIANALLAHPANEELRKAIEAKWPSARELYRQLLVVVYRLLFLMVTEERGQLGGNATYREHYSIHRLRRLVENRWGFNRHTDLWTGLFSTFRLFRDADLGKVLDLPPLGGELFEEASTFHLEGTRAENRALLAAFWFLTMYREKKNAPPRRINYSALDVEELGSVYEGLLELQPVFVDADGRKAFRFVKGTDKKTTGSYYTPPELVEELIKSALVPVIEARLTGAKTPEEKEKRLLSITVCDPACGSGHFLLAATRRLARELARIRSGEDEPSPPEVRRAMRDVAGHCIYGVDLNPLAVQLCKVALWLEIHAEKKPLSFLDHRICCGNSLVGLLDLKVLKNGIPEGAYKKIAGDDEDAASRCLFRNRREGSSQLSLPFSTMINLKALGTERAKILDLGDDSPEEIKKKKELYQRFQADDSPFGRDRLAADLWASAFFAHIREGQERYVPTSGDVHDALAGREVAEEPLGEAVSIRERLRFFHWPLEFPEVFEDTGIQRAPQSPSERRGFDVILGNPPWERIKVQEQEFFMTRDIHVATAPNADKRKQHIRTLKETNPLLWNEYEEALHDAAATGKFLRFGDMYPRTARGDINLYSVFAERMSELMAGRGATGIVVPTGVATDDGNKEFFHSVTKAGSLASLFDFENREGLFPDVHRSYKFSLLTLSNTGQLPAGGAGQAPSTSRPGLFAFFLGRAEQIRDERRAMRLSAADFRLFNPNTKTAPVFRTRQDYELAKKIYERVPVLVNETEGKNPWGVKFLRMFDMSTDSKLFKTKAELEKAGYVLEGNRFVRPGRKEDVFLPLYEAKMIHQFDHRFGSFEGVSSRTSVQLPTPDEVKYADPSYVITPWYWVAKTNVDDQLGGWNRKWSLGFRDIARSTDERTAIFSLMPRTAVGNKIPLWFPDTQGTTSVACLIGMACSLVVDAMARQKIGGTTLNFFYVKQFPFVLPTILGDRELQVLVPRVTELVCTAWDVMAFADDIWREADSDLRKTIESQWRANFLATGQRVHHAPAWYTPSSDGFSHPPFTWSTERRALLRAELDAYYAKLYGLTRDELRYILDPQDVYGPDFPGETFRVLKEKEISQFGEYRTRRLVLEAWDRLEGKD
jgi:hypothetical protein